MKLIEYNYKNVTQDKIEKIVEKARGVILNKEGQALLVKYAGLYMLPGGKIENKEDKREALKREVLEKSGIESIKFEKEPFLRIDSYDSNYYDRELKKHINRLTRTYFYSGITEEVVDTTKQILTSSEKEEEFEISFKNLSLIRYLVENDRSTNEKKKIFDRELLKALDEFKNYRTIKLNKYEEK